MEEAGSNWELLAAAFNSWIEMAEEEASEKISIEIDN